MGNPPRGFWMAANRHGTNGLPILWLNALVLHSTIYWNTRRHPRGGEIVSDPLTGKQEGKLFNEDGSQWWLYISFLNSRHTALLQRVLTFVLFLTDDTLSMLSVILCVWVCQFFWNACRCASFLLNIKICPHCKTRPAGQSAGKCW